jgi:hypothetical protein
MPNAPKCKRWSERSSIDSEEPVDYLSRLGSNEGKCNEDDPDPKDPQPRATIRGGGCSTRAGKTSPDGGSIGASQKAIGRLKELM